MFLILGTVIILLFAVIVLSNFQSIKEYIRYRNLFEKLPTAPRKQFLLGHAGLFFGKSPDEVFLISREMIQNSPATFTISLGPTFHFVGIQEPEEIETHIASMKHIEKSRGYVFLHRWLEEGLLTSKGTKWQRRRKILTPAFHFSILLEFVDTFNTEIAKFLEDIERNYLNHPVNITPLTSNFTLQTMSETSMGNNLDLETEEGMKYKNAVYSMGQVTFERFKKPWLWYDRIYDFTALRKIEVQVVNLLHGFTNNIIRRKAENFQIFDEEISDTSTRRKIPLLDILLNAKFKDQSIGEIGIREEVDTFMFEGHDTTATCLNFTTMLLACHKNIQEDVYQEIVSILGPDVSKMPTYSDLQQMNLLERCIKESLRLYPPVPLIGRKTSEDVSTKYGIIPKGTYTFISLYDLHRNPKYWPNPELFDPSRHLVDNSKSRHPFAFIPFSAGPRNCIGQRFAMLELKAFFCGILRKFILEPIDTPESLVMVQDFILRCRDGIKVKFVLRT